MSGRLGGWEVRACAEGDDHLLRSSPPAPSPSASRPPPLWPRHRQIVMRDCGFEHAGAEEISTGLLNLPKASEYVLFYYLGIKCVPFEVKHNW